MKITIASSDQVVELAPGVQARVWQGADERGTPVVALVALVAVPEGRAESDYAAFERELRRVVS